MGMSPLSPAGERPIGWPVGAYDASNTPRPAARPLQVVPGPTPRFTMTLRSRALASLAAAGLLLGAAACSDAEDPTPNDPADVNVPQDDVLPPAPSVPGGIAGEGEDVDGMDDEGLEDGAGEETEDMESSPGY
jgi:hypothetical protein